MKRKELVTTLHNLKELLKEKGVDTQLVDDLRHELVPLFFATHFMSEYRIRIYEVDGIWFPYHIIKPIINWLDCAAGRQDTDWYLNEETLIVYAEQIDVAAALAELVSMEVIQQHEETYYKQGDRFVEFCKACKFEIKETHS